MEIKIIGLNFAGAVFLAIAIIIGHALNQAGMEPRVRWLCGRRAARNLSSLRLGFMLRESRTFESVRPTTSN